MRHLLFLFNDTYTKIIAGTKSAQIFQRPAGNPRHSMTSQILYFRDPDPNQISPKWN